MYYRTAELLRMILVYALILFVFIGWLGDLSFADLLFILTTPTNGG